MCHVSGANSRVVQAKTTMRQLQKVRLCLPAAAAARRIVQRPMGARRRRPQVRVYLNIFKFGDAAGMRQRTP